MEYYLPLIFRSHLEQQEKYLVPNQNRAVNEVAEVDALKPKVTELDIHEYPYEQVILLKGENLWFAYKICLDENGPNHCEISTPAENTTKFVIEFHVADSRDISSVLRTSEHVKLALFTHFASPIRQHLPTRKVRRTIEHYFYGQVFDLHTMHAL